MNVIKNIVALGVVLTFAVLASPGSGPIPSIERLSADGGASPAPPMPLASPVLVLTADGGAPPPPPVPVPWLTQTA